MTFRSPIRVLIADADDIHRLGLRVALNDDARFSVLGDVRSEVVAGAERLKPDVNIVDPGSTIDDGTVMVRELVKTLPRIRIIVLTQTPDPQQFLSIMLAGAHAYLVKSRASVDMLQRILEQLIDYPISVIDASLFTKVREAQPSGLTLKPQSPSDRLTARERQILTLLAHGSDNAHVAAQLGISTSTVVSHVSNMLVKLEVRNRVHLGATAAELGLLIPQNGDPVVRA